MAYFYDRPVSVQIQERSRRMLSFPRVTICNNNTIKKRTVVNGTEDERVKSSSFSFQELIIEVNRYLSKSEEQQVDSLFYVVRQLRLTVHDI